ncbi:MAG: hypothetical protein HYU28_00750, partial [Actinobacteria bacterium]|nr:hypothetical protein [Actinomycetota bacterium]
MSTASAIVNLGAELVVFVAAASLFLVAAVRPDFLGTRAGSARWTRGVVQAAAV